MLLILLTCPSTVPLLQGRRIAFSARLSKSCDKLAEGVININQSKGADQHRVALHESMLRLLERYDENMAKVMSDRTCFFPNKNDCFHRPAWAEYHFRIIWKEVSKEPARLYDLRSNYAVVNVTRWKGLGFELPDKLLYLSRTMGHRHVNLYVNYLEDKGISDKTFHVECLSVSFLNDWLIWLKQERNCSNKTCNNRLAAIKCLLKYIGIRNPTYKKCYIWKQPYHSSGLGNQRCSIRSS